MNTTHVKKPGTYEAFTMLTDRVPACVGTAKASIGRLTGPSTSLFLQKMRCLSIDKNHPSLGFTEVVRLFSGFGDLKIW